MSVKVVNVTQITGHKVAAGGVTSWQTPDGPYLVEHLAAAAPDGDLMVFYWSPRHDWQAVNVTQITGHKVAAGGVTSWQTPDGPYLVEHLAAEGTDQHLLEFAWSPDCDWRARDLTQVTGARVAPYGTSWQTHDGPFLVEHFGARGDQDDLLVTYRSPRDELTNVLTYHNDNARTGQFSFEQDLTPATVHVSTFGKLFSHDVDGYVYAQPLFMQNVHISGKGLHDVVFVATEHDSVYAFDAHDDHGTNVLPLWHRSFLNPASGVTTVPNADVGTDDIVPEIGITGTPVIDASTRTLYVVAKTKEVTATGTTYVQRLHALRVSNGLDRPGSPVIIRASVPGAGDGRSGNPPVIEFDSLRENQRSALLLQDGVIYIAWASHGDNDPYHGWILGYDARSLALRFVYNSTPDGSRGGIWQGGGGPAADPCGAIYCMTGNGTFDGNANGRDYGDSFLKLSPHRANPLTDYFTPSNEAHLEAADLDLGSGGVLILPDRAGPHGRLLVGAGKEGKIYLLDRDHLGGFDANADQVVQELPNAIGGSFGTPAYHNGRIYYGGIGDAIKAFTSSGTQLTGPASQSSTTFGFPGCTPSISAHQTTGAIVWALQNDGFASGGQAVLHSYAAANLSTELYNTNQAPSRDAPGPAVKFTVPTIAKGRVFVGAQHRLTVYGRL
jgi:hypothetical protein